MGREIRLFAVSPESVNEGPGLHFGIFCQGCRHGCKYCANYPSQDFEGGYLEDTDNLIEAIKADERIHNITFSGGDPIEQAAACADIAEAFPGYTVWVWTGYTWEELLEMAKTDDGVKRLIHATTVLIDGEYDYTLNPNLKKSIVNEPNQWNASSNNQRVIDVQATLALNDEVREIIPYQFRAAWR